MYWMNVLRKFQVGWRSVKIKVPVIYAKPIRELLPSPTASSSLHFLLLLPHHFFLFFLSPYIVSFQTCCQLIWGFSTLLTPLPGALLSCLPLKAIFDQRPASRRFVTRYFPSTMCSISWQSLSSRDLPFTLWIDRLYPWSILRVHLLDFLGFSYSKKIQSSRLLLSPLSRLYSDLP